MIYRYKCTSCSKEHEQEHKMNEQPKGCPNCNASYLWLHRLIASAPVVHSSWGLWNK